MMTDLKPHALQFAIFLIASCTMMTGVEAQKVFKCGTVYSQIPCSDGAGIEAKDNRTSTQKAQADANTVRTAAIANQMEKERLAQEKRDLAAQAALNAQPKSKPAASAKTSSKKKKKEADSEFFTAQAPKAAASRTSGK